MQSVLWKGQQVGKQEIGGPAQKMTFFQMVPKSFLSVLIHSTRCNYNSLVFFLKKIDWNLPVGRVKCEIVGSGWNSYRFLVGFWLGLMRGSRLHFWVVQTVLLDVNMISWKICWKKRAELTLWVRQYWNVPCTNKMPCFSLYFELPVWKLECMQIEHLK